LLFLSIHIVFEFFRPSLETVLSGNYDGSKGGGPPFAPVLIFKVLDLQRLYNLSDDSVEFQIKYRLSFMRFLGLDFAGRIPDAKAVWLQGKRIQIFQNRFEVFLPGTARPKRGNGEKRRLKNQIPAPTVEILPQTT